MTERVLVTGASGFIGYHLVQALLQAGHHVTCLVRKTSDLSHLPQDSISIVYGDLTEPASFQQVVVGVDTVYHLAGLTTAFKPESFYTVNQTGTRNLVQACRECPSPPVFVLLSSLAAAGPSTADHPLTEQDLARPVSNYGRSKLAGEKAAIKFAGEVPMTIVRAAAAFGEWDRDVLQIYQFVKRGFHLIPMPKNARYSAIHAADLAHLLMRAAEGGERCNPADDHPGRGIYYAAYDLHLTYAELGGMVAESIDRKRVLNVMVPKPLSLFIAWTSELVSRLRGRPPGIVNIDKMREFFSGSLSCSPKKALQTLDVEFPISIENRLRQTANWYLDRGWL